MKAFPQPLSFKSRVLLVVVLLFVAGMWGLAVRTTGVLQRDIEKLLGNQMSQTVKFVADNIDSEIVLRIDLLKEVAATITPEIMADPAALRRLLEQRNLSRAVFPLGPFVADKTGTIVADYPTLEGRLGNSIAKFAYFQEVMTSGKPVVAHPFMGRFVKRVVAPLAVPLFDSSGKVAGALVGSVFPSDTAFFGTLEAAKMGATGDFLVVHPTFRLIVSSMDKNRIMQPLPAKGVNSLLDKRLGDTRYEGPGVTVNMRGIEIMSVAATMKTTGWMVLGGVTTAEAYAPIVSLKKQIYLATLLMTVAMVVILSFVLRRQMKPLDDAGARMQRMTRGEEPLAPLPVIRRDEIGRLVETFNQLISERQRAEIALKENEALMRTTFEQAAVGIARIETGTNRILTVNERCCQLLGYSMAELINRDARELTPKEAAKLCHDDKMRLLSGGATISIAERPLYRKDGSIGWFNRSLSLVRDAGGAPQYFIAVLEDISLRKQAAEALAMLATIVDASHDAIVSRDTEGKVLSWSRGAERLFGYSAAEMVGANISVLVPLELRAELRIGKEAMASFEARTHESRRLAKDGHAIDVSISAAPITGMNGSIEGVALIFRDISERKQAEEMRTRLSAIVENSHDAIIGRALDGMVQSWNAGAERMLGYTAAEMIGKLINITVPPGRKSNLPETTARVLRGEVVARETDRLTKDGRRIYVSTSHSPIRDSRGNITGVSVIVRDITARRHAEQERALLEAQLRESQKMEAIGTLAGGIAHDFNNILAIILGNAELARQDSRDNAQALLSIDEIRKAGERARDVVQQILSFSRRQPGVRKPISLAPVVEESVRLLRATLPARLNLNVHCADGLPLVFADATQIQQIVLNLATNAMQAMPSGAGSIGIRLDVVLVTAELAVQCPELRDLYAKRPGPAVCLEISDTGMGMDAATQTRIFDPFFTTKPVNEGTGLGLAVVHGIVQGHEGAITVRSAPGTGAMFRIYLPATRERANDTTSGGDPAVATASATASGLRILYIDDEESVVSMVKRALELQNHILNVYTDPRKALLVLQGDPAKVDLVISDYNMPGISGLDVAREVRKLNPNIPVIVTSGFIDEALRAQAGDAGVRELLFKADALDALCASIARVVQSIGQKTA